MSELVLRNSMWVAQEVLQDAPCLIIEGARQVGKSTLANQLADGWPRAVTKVTLDSAIAMDFASREPEAFVAQQPEGLLIIDEIQRVPQISLAVKAAIDADRRNGRFILTGSSSLLRLSGMSDSLAGRSIRLKLYGFSQGEHRGHTDDIVAALTDGQTATPASELTRDSYADLIAQGAYPAVAGLSERSRSRWLDSYLEDVTHRDLGGLWRDVRPARVFSLLRALAGQQSQELVRAKIAQRSAMPETTVSRYLDLVSDVWLVESLPPWTPQLAKRETGRHKALIVDSGLACRLARVSAAQLKRLEYCEALGQLLEGYVAAELRRQQTWTEQPFELFHYRDRNGLEVDLIAELADGRVIAFEVKASSAYSPGHVSSLVKLRDLLGDRFIAGVVMTTSRHSAHFGDRLYGMPISALWQR